LQKYRKMKTFGGDAPAEYRVHTMNGRVIDMTPRHGAGPGMYSLQSPVRDHVNSAIKHVERGNPDFRKGVLAFDVGVAEEGSKPVIHEFQTQSGYVTMPGHGTLRRIADAQYNNRITNRVNTGALVASPLMVAGGLAGLRDVAQPTVPGSA